jgi:ATP-binding cassette subfamily B multidrug efflux pump
MYPRANVSAERIQEVFDMEPIIKDNPEKTAEPTERGSL